MNIGILEVGQNNAKMNKRRPNYAEMFMTLLETEYASLTFTPLAVQDGIFPTSVSAYDGYLVTGSAYGVYDDMPWLMPLMSFIREAYKQQIPQMGICFGHQVLAHALGGWAEKSEKGWGVGIRSADITAPTDWMKGAGKTISLIYFHQDQVVKLPEGAVRIAGNSFCPNAGFVIGIIIFSLQGHPEFPVDYAEELLGILTPKVGKELSFDALSTLNRPTDNALVADWIRRFFLQHAAT